MCVLARCPMCWLFSLFSDEYGWNGERPPGVWVPPGVPLAVRRCSTPFIIIRPPPRSEGYMCPTQSSRVYLQSAGVVTTPTPKLGKRSRNYVEETSKTNTLINTVELLRILKAITNMYSRASPWRLSVKWHKGCNWVSFTLMEVRGSWPQTAGLVRLIHIQCCLV